MFGGGAFLVLADGMGGHRGGDVAAEATVNALGKWFEGFSGSELDGIAEDELLDVVADNIQQTNAAVFEMGCQEPELRGMGTTLCCVLFHEGRVVYSHTGDSRIYRLRDGVLEQLTRDDSLVSDLLDLGQLEHEDVSEFAYRNVLTKAIGMEPLLEPHVAVEDLCENDLYLICSDGLTNMVEDDDIEKILLQRGGSTKARVEDGAQALVNAAIQGGGRDNVTVVIAAVENAN
ncbi:Putative protein phosphatase 2C-type [Chlamydiales bacterium SCGC AG-110-P3]|nr:Putative protein phosphatase 2C-type [Chlamydiales bacterium SCGC AG-110-P3]